MAAKTFLTICLVVLLSDTLSAQSSNTNYALPANATEIVNTVSNTPGYMLMLSEGGSVPSDGKSTCDGNADGAFKSSTGFSLQHYYDKEQLSQMSSAYASFGGMKGMFTKSVEDRYNDYEKGMHPGPVQKKGKLQTEELQGALVSYFMVTYGCVQTSNPTATIIICMAMLLTDADYAQISNEIYSSDIGVARKYTEETIIKIKALNYEKVD